MYCVMHDMIRLPLQRAPQLPFDLPTPKGGREDGELKYPTIAGEKSYLEK